MILTKDGQKRLLKASEIECRVGQKTKDGSRYSVLLYKTSRTDMDILDEVFGRDNWRATHYEVKGKDFCMIEVRTRFEDDSKFDPSGKSISYEWVGKSDCGSESNIEAEKGESSDAFKRAGFMWGIGRELYSAPQIWVDASISPYSLYVEKIGYNDENEINELVICSKTKDKPVVVFSMSAGKVEKTKSEEKLEDTIKKEFNGKEIPTDEEVKAGLIARIRELKGDEEALCKYFNVTKLEYLSIGDLRKIVDRGEKKNA